MVFSAPAAAQFEAEPPSLEEQVHAEYTMCRDECGMTELSCWVDCAPATVAPELWEIIRDKLGEDLITTEADTNELISTMLNHGILMNVGITSNILPGNLTGVAGAGTSQAETGNFF